MKRAGRRGKRKMWSDDYLDWADQERLVRQDVDEIEKEIRRRKAEAYRKEENIEDERINIED